MIKTLITLVAILDAHVAMGEQVVVASKKFTENVILGEVITQLLNSADIHTIHRAEIGGTRVLWSALQTGEIDIYVDYTGTILKEIFANHKLKDYTQAESLLAKRGIASSGRLGFNNTYALGLLAEKAETLGLKKISDLNRYPELKLGFPNEFMDRGDGWRHLQRTYNLVHRNARGLDHDLSYRGLENASVDVVAVYATDAEIGYYKLAILEDDRSAFPHYDAVILYRQDLQKRHPDLVSTIKKLENSLNEAQMIALNAAVKIDKKPVGTVAQRFIAETLKTKTSYSEATWLETLWVNTRVHSYLVGISLLAAILFSVPLGVVATRFPVFGQAILSMVGVVQTIPSLALLVLLIPLFGIGDKPAIIALFLYSLLPIVRNTYTGIKAIPGHLITTAHAIGLTNWQRLYLIELPMASRSILAGIKTSAILNIGVATIGALIGAGGYGQPILTGIRLDSMPLILQGAIPAAVMALAVQFLFEVIERIVVPKGLVIRA